MFRDDKNKQDVIINRAFFFREFNEMLENGQILQNRYHIEKQIGQGGMGSVYLATDERFNNTVAIKETLFTDDNYRKAFSREARLLNSLKHIALPKVSDTFIEGNGQYIVMEYIAGEDLFEMLEQSGEAFPFEDVKIWASQLLDALEYLHGQQNPIIHRDIKPQNLKLTSSGQVILLDFGLAKGNPTDANHQTAANSIFGYSRNYASLEQIQGTGTDPRSDIYSLAATLYHLATGKPPADALTRVMLVLNDGDDPLQPANLIHEQIPEEFSEVLQRSMSLKANERPQSASEMRNLIFDEQKTAVSTRPNTIPNKAAGTNFLTQNTKVFDESDKPPMISKPSEFKTEVLPIGASAKDSIQTKIARPNTLSDKGNTINSGNTTQTNPNRKRYLAMAAASILLLVGGVSAMFYFWNTNGKSAENKNGSLVNASPAVTNVSEDEIIDANANLVNTNSLTTSVNDESNLNASEEDSSIETIPNEPKSETVAKEETSTQPTAKPTEKATETKNNSSDVKISDGKVQTKDVTISGNKVETKTTTIDEKGVTVKNPPPPPPPLTREQLENLTPAQRRRLREAMERERRLRNKRPPPRP